jgi:hypothetical protein
LPLLVLGIFCSLQPSRNKSGMAATNNQPPILLVTRIYH